MELSAKNYTKEEKNDIFEYVNNLYLHLEGREKSALKRQFTQCWKVNKTIGAYELMLTLYEVYEKWDKVNNDEDFQVSLNNPGNPDNVSFKKYMRHIKMIGQEVEELQEQLDNIQEGKGYISQEQHDQSMLELKEEQQEIIRERSHEAHKYKLEAEMLREKYINSERRLEAQKRFYETALAQVLPEK